MANPNSRQSLIDYCLRALGDPVIEINVDEDQLEDRIDEALQFYQEYHGDAVRRTLRYHKITQDDYDRANDSPFGSNRGSPEFSMYIDIPNNTNMLSINRVLPLHDSGTTNLFSIDYQLHLNDIFDLGGPYGGGLVNYEMTKQYMSLIDRNINGVWEPLQFSRHKNRVYFYSDSLRKRKVGSVIIFDGYEIINPDSFTDVYNDYFLKKYATALIKRQWGLNLIKFEGMQLPGGVTINGERILTDANEEISKLEEEMHLRFEEPPHFVIG
tara:strand:+ start:1394 stop:2200 length:807 start_codon:yes stop_codon:yes gene_type:complete